MELIEYLVKNFYTEQQLVEYCSLTPTKLKKLQNDGLAPKPSYTLKLNYDCHSFFGEYNKNQQIDYYAKGCVSWVNSIKENPVHDLAFINFSERYMLKLKELNGLGFNTANSKLNQCLESHLKEEWHHFLNGTYGLCTVTGQPEDIAAKECAIILIQELLDKSREPINLGKLKQAVNLLDSVSAQFAPHERIVSTRNKYIDKIRLKYLI